MVTVTDCITFINYQLSKRELISIK